MNATNLLRRSALLFSALVLVAGCATTVSGGDGEGQQPEGLGDSGGGGSTATSGHQGGSAGTGQGGNVSTGPGVPTYPAVAVTWSQLDAYYNSQISGENGTSVTTGSGGGLDPNTVFLQVSNSGLTCGVPEGSNECGAAPVWTVSLGLAPGQLVAGSTYTLQELNADMSITAPNEGGDGSCYGGGGSFWDGTVTLDSVTDAGVAFTLSGTGSTFEGVISDGQYFAPKCF